MTRQVKETWGGGGGGTPHYHERGFVYYKVTFSESELKAHALHVRQLHSYVTSNSSSIIRLGYMATLNILSLVSNGLLKCHRGDVSNNTMNKIHKCCPLNLLAAHQNANYCNQVWYFAS